MAIYEYIPEKETLYSSYRKISGTTVTSANPMVGNLGELADQLRHVVMELEGLRTRALSEVLVRIDNTRLILSPKLLYELRQELEKTTDKKDKEALMQAIADLEAEQAREREKFNDLFFPTVKEIRDKCFAVSQNHMADHVIETLADRRKELDRLAKLSKEALLPLMTNLEQQISDIDQNLAKRLDANIFDEALELLPSNETMADLTDLVEKYKRRLEEKEADRPESPDETKMLPDKGEAAEKTEEKTEEPEKLELDAVKTVAPKTEAGAAAKARSGMDISSIISAIPEEEALKLAYQALRGVLSYISEADHVCKQISKRAALRESLDALTKRYEEIQKEYRIVSFDIEDLDRIYQFLDQVGNYFMEMEKLDMTLTSYATALHHAGNNAAAYDGIFLRLRRYMTKLELIWR